MFKRLAAIGFIYICTAVAWCILGTTIFARTYNAGPGLRQKVSSAWGNPHMQLAPTANFVRAEQQPLHPLPLESSRVRVGFDLEPRQKGLLWYSTYKVAFAGTYVFRNTAENDEPVTFTLSFPVSQAVYDDVEFLIDGAPVAVSNNGAAATATVPVGAGKSATLRVGYRSQGLDSWRYSFGAGVSQIRDFALVMSTNFAGIDFPESTLSPTSKRETPNGWELTWTYRNLISGFQIGMEMPQKLQPGPLAGQISYFAPVSLLFFFFLMFIITTLRGIELHPMNYFFLACAFFSFHLLLAYLADHIQIHAAFLICSAVSIALVVSYLRLVVGLRFALVEAALSQLIYLVLFSYAFFLKGVTGLAISIGSILTLFVVMQMTGRIRWAERFARPPAPAYPGPNPRSALE
ncbi:MAG TPA: inner membrane CreD family protein [Bryobacteraceae bacterium]